MSTVSSSLIPINTLWQHQASFPLDVNSYFKTFKINTYEFIVVPSISKASILKYNIIRSKWSKFIDYHPEIETIDLQSIAYDQLFQKLYILQECNTIFNLDINNLQWNKVNISKDCNIYKKYTSIISVNGFIHAIGSRGHSKHAILNDNGKSIELISVSIPFSNYSKISVTSCVYVSSKQQIFAIGGVQGFGIWRYDISENQWTQLQHIRFDYYCVSAALSLDQKSIVIIGGLDSEIKATNSIHILDICNDKYELWKCSVTAPISGINNIVITGGIEVDILVNGWMRLLFTTSEFDQLLFPPLCIIKQIILWFNDGFSEEIIHFVKHVTHWHGIWNKQTEHYTIKMKDI